MAGESDGRGRREAADAEREVDALHGLPLDEFVAARDALAKRLRKAGDRERADAVKRLRKPSVAAWAANQLARRHRDELDELLAAGDTLRTAHRDVLAGDADADALTTAAAAEREAVARLVDRAGEALREAGATASEATLGRVRETLHAAATDDEARADLAAGRLTRERSSAGLGADLLGGLDGGGTGRSAKRPSADGRASGSGRSRPKRSTRSAEADRARERKRAAEAAKQRERLGRERTEARKRLRAAERALRDARREVAAAERRAGRAGTEVDRAREALERVESRLERLSTRQDR